MADKREKAILEIIGLMDGEVDKITEAAEDTQKLIYEFISKQLDKFETADGRFIVNQDYAARILIIERRVREILARDKYTGAVADYLASYSTIQERNAAFQLDYNQLEVEMDKLTPARQTAYKQAAYWLEGAGLNASYVQPVKYLLMQQVTSGASIKEARKLLERWDKGELTTGRIAVNKPTPNLTKYAVQVSRDAIHQMNGTINEIIKTEYELDAFIYVGDVIEDSRPLCRHLVAMDKETPLSEIPELVKKYPQGTIKGTDESNFMVYRGGYSCRHAAVPVRVKQQS